MTVSVDFREPIAAGSIAIHPGRHEVLLNGIPVTLTANEFAALYLLASRPGWVFTRDQILAAVHGPLACPVTDRSVDVMICSMRKKLGQGIIETVRGVGFRLTAATG